MKEASDQSLLHDLSNQLTIIQGRAQKLKKIYDMDKDVDHELERLLGAIEKSVIILNQKKRAK